jgi:hypothetical protein
VKRTPLRRQRRISRRTLNPVTPEIYEAVMRRAGGRCEVTPWGKPCSGRIQWHHRKAFAHGGQPDVVNGLAVCEYHHSKIGNWPAMARYNGWSVHRNDDPAQVPVLRHGVPVLLTATGGVVHLATKPPTAAPEGDGEAPDGAAVGPGKVRP